MLRSRLSTMLTNMDKMLLLIGCFLMGSVMAADVYMTVDENGNPIFTDQEVEGSKKIEVKEVITIPALKDTAPVKSNTDTPQKYYSSLTLVNPKNDETYFKSEGALAINVSASPRLRRGDTLVFFLDGEQIHQSRSTSYSLSELDRGTHTIRVAIVNGNGDEVISSDSITFHLRQASVIRR